MGHDDIYDFDEVRLLVVGNYKTISCKFQNNFMSDTALLFSLRTSKIRHFQIKIKKDVIFQILDMMILPI